MERKKTNPVHENTNTVMKESWSEGNNVHC